MKPHFINTGMDGQPKGFMLNPVGVETPWFMPDKTIYEFALIMEHPLTFIDADEIYYQPCKSYATDQGTVPWLAQWYIPKDRYFGFYPHDSAYKHKFVWMSTDKGVTWIKKSLSRKEADDLLNLMVEFDPRPGTDGQRRTVYQGVRLFGWYGWGRKVKRVSAKYKVDLE